MGVNSPYLRLYRETTGSATLYVHFSVFCHTDFGSVVRSSVCHLRLDLLKKIVPSGLWLKALVHHAALTAYHKDSHAKAPPGDAHASSTILPRRLDTFSPPPWPSSRELLHAYRPLRSAGPHRRRH